MNQPGSISAAPTTQGLQNAQVVCSTVWWVFSGALMVIAVAVLLAGAALTPDQRIAVFMQTGHFP